MNRPKTFFWLTLALVFIFLVAFSATFLLNEGLDKREEAKVEKITVSKVKIPDGTEISVEVADTSLKRQQGLSGRSGLEEGTGMLFVFDKPGEYGFWMKDMLFSIDIIWISEDKRIVHIEENVQPDTFPQTFSSEKDALYVFEVPAGFAEIHDLKVSDSLLFL